MMLSGVTDVRVVLKCPLQERSLRRQKERHIKLGYAITRVPTGPQHPVEKLSAVLGCIWQDTDDRVGEVSLSLSRDTGATFRRDTSTSTSTENSESGQREFQSSKRRCKTIPLSLWKYGRGVSTINQRRLLRQKTGISTRIYQNKPNSFRVEVTAPKH